MMKSSLMFFDNKTYTNSDIINRLKQSELEVKDALLRNDFLSCLNIYLMQKNIFVQLKSNLSAATNENNINLLYCYLNILDLLREKPLFPLAKVYDIFQEAFDLCNVILNDNHDFDFTLVAARWNMFIDPNVKNNYQIQYNNNLSSVIHLVSYEKTPFLFTELHPAKISEVDSFLKP